MKKSLINAPHSRVILFCSKHIDPVPEESQMRTVYFSYIWQYHEVLSGSFRAIKEY